MDRKWRIKNGSYVPFAKRCIKSIPHFSNMHFQWIPREDNEEADALSNEKLLAHGIKPFEREKTKATV